MVIFHSYVSLPEGSCFQPTASQSQTQEVNRIVSKPDPTPLPCFHAQSVDDSLNFALAF
jgi:hypothetical protein